ncbi:hypothetical protein [Eubacterium sp.]
MPNLVNSILMEATPTVLDKTITGTMVQGVLNEVVALIPTVIPVAITFIAIRKGISFVLGLLRSA